MNGNDMAYPCLDIALTPNGTVQCGLTKRELFAAMAMQGILAGGLDSQHAYTCADRAVCVADVLLAALQESPK